MRALSEPETASPWYASYTGARKCTCEGTCTPGATKPTVFVDHSIPVVCKIQYILYSTVQYIVTFCEGIPYKFANANSKTPPLRSPRRRMDFESFIWPVLQLFTISGYISAQHNASSN